MLNRAQIRAINAVRAILRKLVRDTFEEEGQYEAGSMAEAASTAEKSLTNVLIIDRSLMKDSEVVDDDLAAPD